MAALTVVQELLIGIDVAAVAAAGGGDTFANNGKTRALFINGSGGAITVTAVTTAVDEVTGNAIADTTIVVDANATHITAPFPVSRFSATVSLTYSGVTSFTVAVIKE